MRTCGTIRATASHTPGAGSSSAARPGRRGAAALRALPTRRPGVGPVPRDPAPRDPGRPARVPLLLRGRAAAAQPHFERCRQTTPALTPILEILLQAIRERRL